MRTSVGQHIDNTLDVLEVKPEKPDRWEYSGYVGRTVRMELVDSRSRGGCETGYMDIERT